MNKITLIMLMLIVGCSTEPTFKDVTNPIVNIVISENPLMQQEGLAYINGGECKIVLKRYPKCLKHELRHCLEGDWHGKKDSIVDCY